MKYWIYFFTGLLLFSCRINTEKPEEEIEKQGGMETVDEEVYIEDNTSKIDFSSALRQAKTDWNLEETFEDTLEFIEFNSDADYFFAKFKDQYGDKFSFNSKEEIPEKYENKNMVVQWKVGKYYEAGENDAVYYKMKMVKFETIESSYSFEKFIRKFSKDYNSGMANKLKKYKHPFVDIVSTYKPGLYCVEGRPLELAKELFGGEYKITTTMPAGDVCSGYNGVDNIMHYEFFNEAKDLFPRVYDMQDEPREKALYLTEDVIYRQFAKVTVITGGQFNKSLYFFQENNRWFFWVDDSCDCSA